MLVPHMKRAHYCSVSVSLRASTGFRTQGDACQLNLLGPQHSINSWAIHKARIRFGLKLTVTTQGANLYFQLLQRLQSQAEICMAWCRTRVRLVLLVTTKAKTGDRSRGFKELNLLQGEFRQVLQGLPRQDDDWNQQLWMISSEAGRDC